MKEGLKELIIKAKGKDKEAIAKICELFSKYIEKKAKLYLRLNKNLSFEDLVQDGFIGVMNVIETINENSYDNFYLYVYNSINRQMLIDVSSLNDVYAVSIAQYATALEYFDKYNEALNYFEENDLDNILKYMNITKEEFEKFRSIFFSYGLSLNQKVGNGEVIDYVADDLSDTYKLAERDLLNQDITRIICNTKKLNDKRKTVMFLRYGLLDGNERTQAEVGKLIGCTSSYVSNLVLDTLWKLRNISEKIDFNGELDGLDGKYLGSKDIVCVFGKLNHDGLEKKELPIFMSQADIEDSIKDDIDCKSLTLRK